MSDSGSYSDDMDRRSDPRTGVNDGAAAQHLRRPPTPPSLQTPNDSLDQGIDQGSLTARRRSHRKDRDRHSTSRDILKALLAEETESKQSRRLFRAALARLDAETQRAQEAERRALELAARFKVVNEARLAAQQDFNRVNEELRLYKVQYDNAQREILRGQEILKDLEAQRDDAEAVAARARTEARKLREEKLVYRAREEGRAEGYQEGLRRGMEQARYENMREEDDDPPTPTREAPLEELPVRNLPSPSPNGVPLESPVPQHTFTLLSNQLGSSTEPASRFHEHDIGSTPAPGNAHLPDSDSQWPTDNEPPKFIRPSSVVSSAPSVRRERRVPPDGWIPKADEDNRIRLPPANELNPIPTPSQPLPVPPPGQVQEAAGQRGQGYTDSLNSVPGSIPSTTFSQFDMTQPPSGRLSTIRETSMEFSPESNPMPEPLIFPAGQVEQPNQWGSHEEPEGTRTPRSRSSKQRLADELRYDNPDEAEMWRRNGEQNARSPSIKSNSIRHLRNFGSPITTPVPLGPTEPPRRPVQDQFVAPPTSQFYAPPSNSSNFGPPRSASRGDPNMLAPPGPPSRPPSATSSRPGSHRSRSGRSYSSNEDSWDNIDIEIVPPSDPSSAIVSPASLGEDRSMLSPNAVPLPLPAPRSPTPQVPTVPNSPRTMGNYPSMGVLPGAMPGGMHGAPPATAPAGGLPPGFVPLGPPTPSGSSSNLPPMHSTPRTTPADLYGMRGQQPTVSRRRDSLSTTSSDSEPRPVLPPSIARHGRSRSDSAHSGTPTVIVRPPSSASGSVSTKGTSRPSLYSAAPPPRQSQHSAPPVIPPSGTMSPRAGAPASGHMRSLSLNAGSTPGFPFPARTLSTTPGPQSQSQSQLRRMPSDASVGSAKSGRSYTHYEPSEYVDAAYLASSEDLTANVLSPNTVANTRANAGGSRPNIPSALRPGPGVSSPALSYASLR